MDKWELILLDVEEMWAKSAQHKYFPLSASKDYYELERDLFKIRRIYDIYGYKYALKFAELRPDTKAYLDQYVLCMQEGPHKFQCSIFCHKYDFKKGCQLNAYK